MAELKVTEAEIQSILNKGLFSEDEINEAIAREDLNEIDDKGKPKVFTKTLKLNMNNLKDRLLAVYLEDKNFTEVVWTALEIYKQHFDVSILLQEKLDRLKRGETDIPTVSNPKNETAATMEEPVKKEIEVADADGFMNV